MRRLVILLIFSLTMLSVTGLQGQLSFELFINSATTIQIQATARIHNNLSNQYYQETSHSPFLFLGVDGPPFVAFLPVMGALQIPANSFIEMPVTWFMTEEPLAPGLHEIRLYSTLSGSYNPVPVTPVLQIPIGFSYPQPLSWQLHVDTAEQYGVALRLQLTNLSQYDWHYSFNLDPFVRLVLDGFPLPYNPQLAPTAINLVQNESCYIPLRYIGYLSQGPHQIQAEIHLNDWEGYIPVGEPVNFVVSDIEADDIGIGNDLSRAPIDFWWRNSLYQCVYTIAELGGIAGAIHSLAFYTDQYLPDYNYPAQNVKVMLGHTTSTDLTAGWFDPAEMTLVFDGPVDFPIGQEQIKLDLNELFLLPVNSSLVISVERGWTDSYAHSAKPFQCQSADPHTVRYAKSDVVDYDVHNPPAANESQYYAYKPRVTVFYVPGAVEAAEDVSPAPSDLNCRVWPNPFNPNLNINFELEQPTLCTLTVYNNRGQVVRSLIEAHSLPAASHTVVWDGKDDMGSEQSSGVYLVKLETPGRVALRRVILSK